MKAEPASRKTISCLLMTYNCKDTLPRTLKSILLQDYPSIEIVVADGGSTDGTVDVLRKLQGRLSASDDRITALHSSHRNHRTSSTLSSAEHETPSRTLRFISEPDSGLYDALNKAVHMATGDYLIVANDMLAKKDSLTKLADALESGPFCGAHADLVYVDTGRDGSSRTAHPQENKTSSVRRRWHMGNGRHILTGWMPGHPSLLLKREIYETYGNYKTDYRIAADYEFMMRFLRHKENRLAYVPVVLVKMYYGGTSTAKLSDYIDSFKEGYRALRENGYASLPSFFATCCRTVRVLLQF